MENLYSTHNICRTLLLFYLGQMQICEVKLRDFDEISTILMQHRPHNQEYRPHRPMHYGKVSMGDVTFRISNFSPTWKKISFTILMIFASTPLVKAMKMSKIHISQMFKKQIRFSQILAVKNTCFLLSPLACQFFTKTNYPNFWGVKKDPA